MSVELALTLLFQLIDRASAVSALIAKAKAENRDITKAELDTLVAADDAAKKELDAAIAKAKAEGK